MNVHGLNDEQRQRLRASLTRHRDKLDGIIKRMQSLGWYTDDSMFQTILAARHALHAAVNSFAPTAKQPAPPADRPTGRIARRRLWRANHEMDKMARKG